MHRVVDVAKREPAAGPAAWAYALRRHLAPSASNSRILRRTSEPRAASTRPTTATAATTARAHVRAHPDKCDDDDHTDGAAAEPVPSECAEAEKKRSA